jgi:hypothetical protein
MNDRFGQEIRPGVVVTYPGRASSSLWVNDAIVKDFAEGEDWRGRPVTVLKVEIASDGEYLGPGRGYVKKLKIVTLTKLDRLTVLPHVGADALRAQWLKGD